jgi:hypothetical protein
MDNFLFIIRDCAIIDRANGLESKEAFLATEGAIPRDSWRVYRRAIATRKIGDEITIAVPLVNLSPPIASPQTLSVIFSRSSIEVNARKCIVKYK